MKINKIYESAKDTTSRIQEFKPEDRIQNNKRHIACTIKINPSQEFNSFDGFGGALTESSGYVLSFLSEEKRNAVMQAYYSSANGIGYTHARVHLNSSDFSLENWACVEKKDETLESFSMERTDKYITPIVKEAQKNTKNYFNLLISPWSPPAWMKDNGEMNHGGKLLKNYYPLWAKYFVRFIAELKKRDINTWAVTVQNEPEAKQVWDSCLYTAQEEAEFAVKHLGPELEKYKNENSLKEKIKIFVWDHNRDFLWERFSASMAFEGADKYIDGAAFHWYSGDQYENIEKVSKAWPDKSIVFTEGCIEGGARPGAWFPGERYAHNIINDLNHGCTAWIDWNIALDMEGGPNHVGNFCDAPVLVDTKKGEVLYQSSFYYIGHFSRFIKPKAKRIEFKIDSYRTPATVDGMMGEMMECCAFKNTDGTITFVVMNRTEADMVFDLNIENDTKTIKCPPRGIQTIIIEK